MAQAKRHIDGHLQRYLDILYKSVEEYIAEGDLLDIVTGAAHDGMEDITNRRMESLAIPCIQEKRLPNDRVIDNLIIRNELFKKLIEDKQSVISKEVLRAYKVIGIDNTISPDETWFREKCEQRGYATKDRLLIIVLYGYHSDSTIHHVRDIVNEYENVQLLTGDEYSNFIGLSQDNSLLAEYQVIQQACLDAFDERRIISETAIGALVNVKADVKIRLKMHKNRWLEYFQNHFLGCRP